MSDTVRSVLVPQYLRKFSCIGSDCEDTCCAGWRVEIDRPTYKKYQKARTAELTPLFEEHVKRNKKNPQEHSYGYIKMDAQGACPFLSQERLCKIQLAMGEHYLSDVCASYPRIANTINGVLEKSATMSCPEAVRLALLEPDGIEFDEIEEPVGETALIAKRLNTTDTALEQRPERFVWELRIFTIQVLQNRAYTLGERLVMLGMFYQSADEYVRSDRVQEIPQLIASFTVMVEEGQLREDLGKIPSSLSIQMQLVKELADQRIADGGIRNRRYLECLSECLHGINYTRESTVEEATAHYQAAYEAYYRPFMIEHHYILENYLVNHVYKSLFPFTGYSASMFDEYVMVIIHYAMIKMHLIGIAGFRRGLSTDACVKLVQSLAKTVEHSPQYLRRMLKVLQENGYTNMAYMAILIIN